MHFALKFLLETTEKFQIEVSGKNSFQGPRGPVDSLFLQLLFLFHGAVRRFDTNYHNRIRKFILFLTLKLGFSQLKLE